MKGRVASSAQVGCVLGVMMAGSLSDHYGLKPAMISAGACRLDRSMTTWSVAEFG